MVQAFELMRMRGLRNGAFALSAFLGLMVPWRLLGGPCPDARRTLVVAGMAGGWSLIVLGYAALLHRWRFRKDGAEGPAFGLVALGLCVALTQLLGYARMQETAATLMIAVVSGALLQRRRWLVAFQALLGAGWLGTAWVVGGWAQARTWLFDLALAMMMAFALQALLGRLFGALMRRLQRQRRLLQDLRAALDNVQTLGGLLPICSHCKKIRNDGGYWEQVESYLKAHSDLEFTHGICPDCRDQVLAELRSRNRES